MATRSAPALSRGPVIRATPTRRRTASVTRYLNRELSWLDFNERVLTLATDTSLPLLERLRFLSFFAINLDEFYQVRVAGLRRQEAAGLGLTQSADGMTAIEQLAGITERVEGLATRHARLFRDELVPGLAAAGIHIARWSDLDLEQRTILNAFFEEHVFPVLTPLAVDPGHPFPYISNLSLNLAVQVAEHDAPLTHFARVKVPPLLGRFASPEAGIFVPLEDVIAANLGRLFPGMRVMEHHAFRVTRNADVEIDDDGAEDLLEALEETLRKHRFSPAVRLEVEDGMPDRILQLLVRELQVQPGSVLRLPGPLDLAGLMELTTLDEPGLKDPPFQPVTPPSLSSLDGEPPDMFALLRNGDLLVHHPYESFAASTQRFIEQAAADPKVLAIKQTLYRTSGESPIVDALVSAAAAGKQVVVLVEIKARFDEQNNIAWARLLEQAGCHVVYGVVGLKTHAKLCLVVREEGGRIRRYMHLGTGNYNPSTARVYEDVGLFTADEKLGAEVSSLFNYLTGYSRHPEYQRLVVAPQAMRQRVVELIEREARHAAAGEPGLVRIKVNNLIDEAVIEALYTASQAGVRVELIIRSICALRPAVPGLSEGIAVRSILGRFLEHSRILHVRNGGQDEVYIGSADLMHRNLDRRVETLIRVDDEIARGRLLGLLDLSGLANVGVWTLGADGGWTPIVPASEEVRVDIQRELMQRALGRA
jgi:polyphosphate kinase